MGIIKVKFYRTIILTLLFGGLSLYADTLAVKTEWVDASLKYNVKDPSRQLESELLFPAQTVVGTIGYDYLLSRGTVSFQAYHSLASIQKTGWDKDWKNGEMTVYSESTSTINKLYGLEMAYSHQLSEHMRVSLAFFHEYWKLTWYDTKQYSYYNDRYDEFTGATVRFTQQNNGANIRLKYDHTLFDKSWKMYAGLSISKQRSVDRHLERSFYTLSNDWIVGYSLGLDVEVFRHQTSAIALGAGYSFRKGDADMEFFHEYGTKFMTLPATFQTTVKSLHIRYHYSF